MTIDWGILIGLLSIALALFFGLLFGLKGLRNDIVGQLSAIREKVAVIEATVTRVWDLLTNAVPLLLQARGGTVERDLKNLGKVRIEARPGVDETQYFIEVERPVLHTSLIVKFSKETELAAQEKKMFGQEPRVTSLSRTQAVVHVPSADPKVCTEYMSFFLKWLDSTYFVSLQSIREFEEPILKDSE